MEPVSESVSSMMKVPLIFTAALVNKLPQDLWKAEALIHQQARNQQADPNILLDNALLYLKLGLSTHAIGEVNRAQFFISDSNLPQLNLLHRINADAYLQMCNPATLHPISMLIEMFKSMKPKSMNALASVIVGVPDMSNFINDSNEAFEAKIEVCETLLNRSLPSFENVDALLVAIAYKYAIFFIIRASREKLKMKKLLLGNNMKIQLVNNTRGGAEDIVKGLGQMGKFYGLQTTVPQRYRSGPDDDRSYKAISTTVKQITSGMDSSIFTIEVQQAPEKDCHSSSN